MSDETYQEIEIKLYAPDLDAVRQRLEHSEAKLVSPRVHEVNYRYDTPDGAFVGQHLVLRLRQDNKIRITYKEPQDEQAQARGVHQRYEAEIVVDDFQAADTILQKLGFVVYMSYEKYRTTYQIGGAEVVLDEMPYGSFVEIEAGNEDAIQQTAEHLGLHHAPRLQYSYSRMFDHVRGNLGLSFRDLTFENFRGVTVPFEAFAPPDHSERS